MLCVISFRMNIVNYYGLRCRKCIWSLCKGICNINMVSPLRIIRIYDSKEKGKI
uniref:Uncharacterized protein n=1 Tax=Lepeophtheirus salmonis TaxID=72036 RepID=A0A0K2TTF2_LEPSM